MTFHIESFAILLCFFITCAVVHICVVWYGTKLTKSDDEIKEMDDATLASTIRKHSKQGIAIFSFSELRPLYANDVAKRLLMLKDSTKPMQESSPDDVVEKQGSSRADAL